MEVGEEKAERKLITCHLVFIGIVQRWNSMTRRVRAGSHGFAGLLWGFRNSLKSVFFCSESVCVTPLSECRCVFGWKRLINLKCGDFMVSWWLRITSPNINVTRDKERERTGLVCVWAAGWRTWAALISSPLYSHNPKQICAPSRVSGCWGHHFSLAAVMMMDPRTGHQGSELQRPLAPPTSCYINLHHSFIRFSLICVSFKTTEAVQWWHQIMVIPR